jgi:hypothetical protein
MRCLNVLIFRTFDAGELPFHSRHRSDTQVYFYRHRWIMSRKVFLAIMHTYLVFCHRLSLFLLREDELRMTQFWARTSPCNF